MAEAARDPPPATRERMARRYTNPAPLKSPTRRNGTDGELRRAANAPAARTPRVPPRSWNPKITPKAAPWTRVRLASEMNENVAGYVTKRAEPRVQRAASDGTSPRDDAASPVTVRARYAARRLRYRPNRALRRPKENAAMLPTRIHRAIAMPDTPSGRP